MSESSLASQDISDPDALKTFLLQTLANSSEYSNPYDTIAFQIKQLIEQRAPLTAVSIVEEVCVGF